MGCASHSAPRPTAVPASGAIVYIAGHEVHSPGSFPWHSGMMMTELIQAAGGLSEFADHSHLRVTHADGTQNDYKYARIFRGKAVELMPGDRVYVITPIF
jgi:protein involved in polysaccharide export with SLBB domain